MRWHTTSYAVDERGIHWQSGLVRKKSTTVPLGRIQGLDRVAGPVQRLFGVVAVNVQTAGGGAKGEIVLEALGPKRSSGCARRCARAARRSPTPRRRAGCRSGG